MTASPDVPPPDPAIVRDPAGRRKGRSGPGPIRLCPYVASGDGRWRSAHPSRAHRCGAVHPAAQLAISKQRQLCLVDAHGTCATYLAARVLDPSAAREPAPDDARLWPASRPTVVNLEQARIGFAAIPAAHGRSGGQALLVGLMVVALLVLVIARTTSPASTDDGRPGASASAVIGAAASPSASSPAVEPSMAPSAAPSPTPAGSVAPSAAASATPVSSAGAQASPAAQSPSPAPSDARLYKVRSGDTLSTIALKFGVTVKAIKLANGITDPRVIRVGRVLIIP